MIGSKEKRVEELKNTIGLYSIELFQMYKLFYSEDMDFKDVYLEYKINAMMCILDEYGVWDNPFRAKTSFKYNHVIRWVSEPKISLRFKIFIDVLEFFDEMHELTGDDLESIHSMKSNVDKELVSVIGGLIEKYCQENDYNRYDFVRNLSCILCFRNSKGKEEIFEQLMTYNIVKCSYGDFLNLVDFIENILGISVSIYNTFCIELNQLGDESWDERKKRKDQAKEEVLKKGRDVKKKLLQKNVG